MNKREAFVFRIRGRRVREAKRARYGVAIRETLLSIDALDIGKRKVHAGLNEPRLLHCHTALPGARIMYHVVGP